MPLCGKGGFKSSLPEGRRPRAPAALSLAESTVSFMLARARAGPGDNLQLESELGSGP